MSCATAHKGSREQITVLLDSNVLASFIIEKDSRYLEADKIIRHLFAEPANYNIILPPLVIYETSVVVIRAGYSETITSNRLHKLLTHDQVVVLSLSELAVFKHLRRTARHHVREAMIRTHDMLILNTAIDFDASIVTFDSAIQKVCQRLNYPVHMSLDSLLSR